MTGHGQSFGGFVLRITRFLAVVSVSGLALSVSVPAVAQDQWFDPRWEALSPSERVIIDRVASEIYADAMRAQRYRSAQDPYADPRVSGPTYRTLAERQKAPFRAYAINQLTGGAQEYQPQPQQPYYYQEPPQRAPEPAMRNEI